MMYYFISVLKYKIWKTCLLKRRENEISDLNCVSVVCVLVRLGLIWIEVFVNEVKKGKIV